MLPHNEPRRPAASVAGKFSLPALLLSMPTIDEAGWRALPLFWRWLIMIRAPVLVMTLMSVAIGCLCAAKDGHFYWDRMIALAVGLGFAHATNNMVNDLVDWQRGIDVSGYLRSQYGVHALAQQFVSREQFYVVLVATALVSLIAGGYLTWQLGDEVFYLMLAGSFFVVFYTWPLKHLASGEVSVLLVWGPLMTGGSYLVMAGDITTEVIILSLAFGIGPTLVIMGKHLDKLSMDQRKGIRTLPVMLGEAASRKVCICMIALQWMLLLGWAYFYAIGFLAAIVIASVPAGYALLKVLGARRPVVRPEGFPAAAWPLWFAAYAFRYNRDFGLLLILVLVVSLVANPG